MKNFLKSLMSIVIPGDPLKLIGIHRRKPKQLFPVRECNIAEVMKSIEAQREMLGTKVNPGDMVRPSDETLRKLNTADEPALKEYRNREVKGST